MTPRDRLRELFSKVDTFFAATKQKHGAAITCHAGCDDCCKRRFSVTMLEADAIRQALSELSDDDKETLAKRASHLEGTDCPALGDDGRCAVYAARPMICRTHGLPIRFTEARNGRSLPIVDACPKNFSGLDLAGIEPKSVLDQATLSTVLLALDAAYADECGFSRGGRVEMTALCREGSSPSA
jgi:hypothetical protein